MSKRYLSRLIRLRRNGYTYELPGGKVKDKEEIIDGAMRELREETGLIANELIELGTILIPSGDVSGNHTLYEEYPRRDIART